MVEPNDLVILIVVNHRAPGTGIWIQFQWFLFKPEQNLADSTIAYPTYVST